MRKSVTLGIVCITCLIAFVATDRIALGQAGSTGGTIGKTDKAASGGEDLDENRGRPHRANKQSGPAGGSLTGRWDWEAICYGIRYFGDFRLREVGGQLTGEFLDDSGGLKGGQISGSVHGTEVSFVRDSSPRFYYKLESESPNRMKGSTTTGVGGCDVTAKKR
jgi:hypothetical protein